MRSETLIKTTNADGSIVRAVLVGAWRSPVSAPVWGTGGRGFKSRRPDQINNSTNELFSAKLFSKNQASRPMSLPCRHAARRCIIWAR